MESKTNAKRMNAGMQRLIEGSSWEVVAKANFEQGGPSSETESPATNETRNASKAQAPKKEGEQESKTKRETDVKSKTHQESKTSTTLPLEPVTGPWYNWEDLKSLLRSPALAH